MPMVATTLVSGALLAFALSFDEVIVTVFTAGAQNTLPLWIFGAVIAARVAGAGAITRSVRAVPTGESAQLVR